MAKINCREEWRVTHISDRYEVSNLGRVRSWMGHAGRGRRAEPLLLKPYLTGYEHCQYPTVSIYGKNAKVHTLVATAFLGGKPTDKHEVNHIDGDKANNAVDNLEWVTDSENVLHAFRTGLAISRKGERINTAKLTEDDVRAIRNSTEPGIVLARRYGVSNAQISHIRRRKHWRHIA
jgi:hypothetical protein